MFKKEEARNFELVMQVRNMDGQPTGKTKSYSHDNAFEIWQFWMNNKVRIKKNGVVENDTEE